MIVQSDKVGILKDSMHGQPVLVQKGGMSFDTFTVHVEPSKAMSNKCMIGLNAPPVDAYHKAVNGSNVACGCAYVELIHVVQWIDPKAVIICAGLKCDVTGWENSLKNLIPCKGLKDQAHKEKMAQLEALKKKPSSILAGTLGALKTPKAPKVHHDTPKELVNYPGEYALVPGELETIPIAGKSKLVRSVHGAVYNFYALEEMSLNDNLPPVFMPRFKEFVESTARTMFDYLATICMSECRHAGDTLWNVYGVNNEHKSRHNAWTMGREFNPRQSLKVCEYLFVNASFPGGYGGKPWANIAHCAGRYFDLPVKSWFDHVVDLAHNGGLAFNKGVFWYNPVNNNSYIHMLDRRKHGSVFDDGKSDGYGMQTFHSTHGEQKWLLYCAGLIDEPGPKIPPLKWGTKLVECQMGVYDAGGDNEDFDPDNDTGTTHKAERIL